MPVITALKAHKRDKDRVKLVLDDGCAMDLPLMEAARLQPGQRLSQTQLDALAGAQSFQRAFDRALRFLSYRPRSAQEVRRRLLQAEVAEAEVEAVIEGLSERGYLDDLAFARYWLDNRNRFKPRGPRALRYELWQKGVETSIIDAVLMDLDAQDAAYRAASSQIQRYRGYTRQQFGRKMSAMLHRRGFDSETINDVVRRLWQELDQSEDGACGHDTRE